MSCIIIVKEKFILENFLAEAKSGMHEVNAKIRSHTLDNKNEFSI